MNNIKVVGKGGISATIIAHSKSVVDGSEIITFELEYHRYIHGEFKQEFHVQEKSPAPVRLKPLSGLSRFQRAGQPESCKNRGFLFHARF